MADRVKIPVPAATLAAMTETLICEVRSGEGGDDAALFARQLSGALGR